MSNVIHYNAAAWAHSASIEGLDILPPHTIITIGPRRSMSSPPGKSAMSDRSYLRRQVA